MLPTRVTVIVLAATALLCASCKEGIKVTVEHGRDTAPTFILESLSLISRSVPAVSSITVSEWSTEGHVQFKWRLETVDGKPHPIARLTYGRIPPEFRECEPAEALKRGRTYSISAESAGRMGHKEFSLD